MSTLTEQFPTKLNIGGAECLVNSDFRTVLRCYEVQGGANKLEPGKLSEILRLFYPKVRRFSEEHIDKMFWFFACGREKEKKKFPRKVAGLNNKQPFDFETDADLIYAGFMQQYGIDLQEEDMHWWKFMILLENLGADTRLSRIMEYRTIDTSSKNLSKEQRKFLKAMQRYFELGNTSSEKSERLKKIEDALLNGGDISKVLAGDE